MNSIHETAKTMFLPIMNHSRWALCELSMRIMSVALTPIVVIGLLMHAALAGTFKLATYSTKNLQSRTKYQQQVDREINRLIHLIRDALTLRLSLSKMQPYFFFTAVIISAARNQG